MIKFWAWIYRRTGWFCPLVDIYQYKYLMTRLDHIAADYSDECNHLTLKSLIYLEIGSFQCEHGFYRPLDWKGKGE